MKVHFSSLSDETLCEKIDDVNSFKEIEFRYFWLVRHIAQSILSKDTPDKDDYLQEGLLGLYYASKTYNPNKGASFKTYANACIYNQMINEFNRNKRRNNHLDAHISIDEIESLVPSPEQEIELRDDFNAVLNQIHISLSEFEKKILALYLSGYKRSEISVEYGISLKAYDNALQRVKNKLKNHGFKTDDLVC